MRSLKGILTFVICTSFADISDVSGQVLVVVNRANPIQDISLQKLLDIYMGNELTWRPRQKILPVSLKSRHTVARSFFERGLGKSVQDMQRWWIKLTLSGEAMPPKIVGTEKEVLEYVATHENAIGFVALKDPDDRVRVITVDKKRPAEEGYPLRFRAERSL